jgi:hypothetical protein
MGHAFLGHFKLGVFMLVTDGQCPFIKKKYQFSVKGSSKYNSQYFIAYN